MAVPVLNCGGKLSQVASGILWARSSIVTAVWGLARIASTRDAIGTGHVSQRNAPLLLHRPGGGGGRRFRDGPG
jgi:hypothetical protein